MRKELQTQFSPRQYMVSRDFEIYYYSDTTPTKVPPHIHDYYEFYFFLEGDVSLKIGDELHRVNCGDIMLIPPQIKHCPVFHSANSPYRRFVFWISRNYCKYLEELSPDYIYLMKHVQTHGDYLFHCDYMTFNGIQSRALRLIEEMRSDHFGKHAQISLCVNDLVLHINRIIYARLHPGRKSEESIYQNLCSYIEEHLDEDLSLEKLASEFFVSKYHIAHVFKDNLGLSIHQYITKKRLSKCCDALIGNTGITDTYQAFGFGDYSSFYRAFKKEYGISPKEWQDMHFVQYDKSGH